MSRRTIYLLLVALVVAGGVGAYVVITRESLREASDSMRSGPRKISLNLSVDIPKGSETDNQDHQEISASGVADYSTGEAEFVYDFQGLNNAAGFLGHFDIMDVLYSEGIGYLDIFNSGPAWVSIEPEDASNGDVARLRDVMLTSPMVLPGLLETAADAPEGSAGETSREVSPSTLADSDDELAAGLGSAFEELGVELVLVDVAQDDAGVFQVVVSFDYEAAGGRNQVRASYEVAPGEGDVSVEIPSDSDTRKFSDIFS